MPAARPCDFRGRDAAQWLHDLLIDHAERVIVCNVRGRSETTNKSDRIYADALSEQLRIGALKPVFHGAPEILALKGGGLAGDKGGLGGDTSSLFTPTLEIVICPGSVARIPSWPRDNANHATKRRFERPRYGKKSSPMANVVYGM